jgi:hypothetical protein
MYLMDLSLVDGCFIPDGVLLAAATVCPDDNDGMSAVSSGKLIDIDLVDVASTATFVSAASWWESEREAAALSVVRGNHGRSERQQS